MHRTRLRRRLSDLTDLRVGYSHRSAYPVAIASGKGGTGKSILATNLALVLAELGRKVLLVDADFGLGNVHLLMGINPSSNVSHVLKNERTIREVVRTCFGVNVLPGGSGVTELASLSGPQLLALGDQLELMNSETDVILFDTSSGLSRHTILILLACREVIIVTNPDITAITDAYALIKALAGYRFSPRIGLIVNRVKDEAEAGAIFGHILRVSTQFLGKEIFYYGHVVNDECVNRATVERRPVVASYPMSKSGHCIRAIATQCEWAPDGDMNFAKKLRGILYGWVRR